MNIKTDKKEQDVSLLGQSTDPDVLEEAAERLNDNEQFVKKADGSIFGNNSSFEIVTKDEMRAASVILHEEAQASQDNIGHATL